MHRINCRVKRRTLFCLAGGIVIVFMVCLGLGRYSVPPTQTAKILLYHILPVSMNQTWDEQMSNVILNIRLPRLVGALLVGGALSISGATYQGLFKNPLVSPDLLGVSSGACVGAALAIFLGCSPLTIQLAALASGLLSVLIATMIPRFFKNGSSLMLVLAGIIVSGFMSALLGLLKYVADPESELSVIIFWIMGSLASVSMRDVGIVAPAMVVSFSVLLALRWRVNLLSLGDAEAKSLGVNVERTRGIAILCSTVLTACAVCMCGTIGWVGLIMPHLGRLVIGEDNRYLIPAAGLLGALFMVVVDTLARNLTGSEIPLSIITGLLGAPLFLWLLMLQKARIH